MGRKFQKERLHVEVSWFTLLYSRNQHWRRQWHPTPVLLPGKSHGQRSLVGCSSWGHEELDTTERLHFHFSLSCIGEGNGYPLQCSCLENPRDGGVWWAAVYGVTQSWKRLKRLSRSSSKPFKSPIRYILIIVMPKFHSPCLSQVFWPNRKDKEFQLFR